jgi:pimeloyl-ACP methyl ester carboxylesterase
MWHFGLGMFSDQVFTQAAFVFCDAAALAMLGGALTEVMLLRVLSLSGFRRMSLALHAAFAGPAPQLPLGFATAAASLAELLLVLDLAAARVFHTARDTAVHIGPVDNPDGADSVKNAFAILVHGLDLDGSSLSLLAHVLTLHGIPAAVCNYHADRSSGYLHHAGDSVDAYATTCLSQVELLLRPAAAQQRRRVALVGHSMGGLVACRMAKELARTSPNSVEVVGVLTVCTPLGGIPFLTRLAQHHQTIRNFLQTVRRLSWFDPRRLVGEFVRVERWIWDEMAAQERLRAAEAGGCPTAAAAAGQDAIVPAESALAGATTKHLFRWASHNNLLCSRRACEILAHQVVAFTIAGSDERAAASAQEARSKC